VNKYQVQYIVLSRIVVEDQSTGRKEDVKVQKYDESIDEEDSYTALERVFFLSHPTSRLLENMYVE
jgi:hypothetical protein